MNIVTLMKTVFIKVIFMSKIDLEKNTQISSEGAAVPRQVMKHVVRNPCKISLKKIKAQKVRQI